MVNLVERHRDPTRTKTVSSQDLCQIDCCHLHMYKNKRKQKNRVKYARPVRMWLSGRITRNAPHALQSQLYQKDPSLLQ